MLTFVQDYDGTKSQGYLKVHVPVFSSVSRAGYAQLLSSVNYVNVWLTEYIEYGYFSQSFSNGVC